MSIRGATDSCRCARLLDSRAPLREAFPKPCSTRLTIVKRFCSSYATVAWAKSTGKADTSRLGITGFCWGGRQVWLYAAHNPDLKAGVAWYGPLQLPKSDNAPINPADEVARMNAPVLGLYGGADQSIPASQIDAMRAAIKAGGKLSEIVVYPETPHAFNADYRPSYRAKEAKDGWARMLDWFRKNGVTVASTSAATWLSGT